MNHTRGGGCENLNGSEIGGLCGFLGQFCVILHLKFQTKNWEFFMVHHLKKSNKSTKCDPKAKLSPTLF